MSVFYIEETTKTNENREENEYFLIPKLGKGKDRFDGSKFLTSICSAVSAFYLNF